MLLSQWRVLDARTTACAIVAALTATGAAVRGQTAELRLIVLNSPSASDTTTTLPISENLILENAAFFVEVWAQTVQAGGLSSVSADLTYNPALINVTAVAHTPTFDVLTHGVIDNLSGLIDDLSGSHLGACTDAVGVAPAWARVAVLDATALGAGSLVLQSAPTGTGVYGTALCGVGDVPSAQITFGSATVSLVECLQDGDCDDGQFCNGGELCDPGTNVCQPGTSPTCDDQIECTDDSCDPLGGGGAGACAHVANDGHCSDAVDCTTDVCDPLSGPGTGCVVTANDGACDDLIDCTIDACDPLAAPGTGCSNVPSDALCDNALFCDGAEVCDALQGCTAGEPPCADACEHCVEAATSCAWCLLDLDSSAVMGTGDFSLFAPCFGGCYPPGDPCSGSDFDQDPGGCVGTADFAVFAGCFGATCAACPACSAPGGGAAARAVDAAPAEFRLALRSAASGSDTAAAVPTSQAAFGVGASMFLEVWVQTTDPQGLSSASLDLAFDPSLVTGVTIVPSAILSELTAGTIDNLSGVIDDLSGSHLGPCTDAVARFPNWARLAVVEFTVNAPGVLQVGTSGTDSPVYGTSVCGVGDVDPAGVIHDSVTATLGTAAIPATSTWGLATLGLLMLAVGTLSLRRRTADGA